MLFGGWLASSYRHFALVCMNPSVDSSVKTNKKKTKQDIADALTRFVFSCARSLLNDTKSAPLFLLSRRRQGNERDPPASYSFFWIYFVSLQKKNPRVLFVVVFRSMAAMHRKETVISRVNVCVCACPFVCPCVRAGSPSSVPDASLCPPSPLNDQSIDDVT